MYTMNVPLLASPPQANLVWFFWQGTDNSIINILCRWQGLAEGWIFRWNILENLETNPYKYSELLFGKNI